MQVFYKGEIIDTDPKDINEIYVVKRNKNLYIKIYGDSGEFILDDDVAIFGTSFTDNKGIAYFTLLEEFLSEHTQGLFDFDKDTLTIIVKAIGETYETHIEMCNSLQRRLNGVSNTKSAK